MSDPSVAAPPAPARARRGSRGPRGPYAKTAATRQAILDAALEVFGETGYHKGSLREIAARIGISEAGVLHHFPSKRALLLATLEHRDDVALRDVFPPDLEDGLPWLLALVELIRVNMTHPGVIELYSTLAGEASGEDHPAHEYFTRRYASVVGSAEEHFEIVAGEGLLRPDVAPASAARQLIALMDGMQIQWLYTGRFDMAAELVAFLDLVLVEPLTDSLD
jgi:AcrR family transcriptional regulator